MTFLNHSELKVISISSIKLQRPCFQIEMKLKNHNLYNRSIDDHSQPIYYKSIYIYVIWSYSQHCKNHLCFEKEIWDSQPFI